MMQYIGVSECDMEKGQLRCDANVSVRLRGTEKFGTKVEVKNLNSFRFVKIAMNTRLNARLRLSNAAAPLNRKAVSTTSDSGLTVSMRSKEHAHDYRYFPDLIWFHYASANTGCTGEE